MGNDKTEVQQLREETLTGFAKIDERFAKIDERFAKIDERFDQVEKRFDQVEKRIEESQEETRRYFDIVTERNHDMIRLLIEQMRSDRSLLGEVVNRVERLEERDVSTNHRLTLLERNKR